jgi:serine O-acetyltransferase
MKQWLNEKIPDVANRLEKSLINGFTVEQGDRLDITGRNAIYSVLDEILAVLFPGAYSNVEIEKDEVNYFLTDTLRHISYTLGKQIRDVFRYRCDKDNCENCTCEQRASDALKGLIEALPDIRETLLEDIKAAYEGDPAARYVDEIVLSYPCIEAIATYRIAHQLYVLDVPIIPRIMSERAHSKTGIDIHPGAQIGPQFFIDHGTGVVIGETTTIGKHVKLYQGVTLGAMSFKVDSKGNPVKGIKRHPDIENDVVIYANATILGGSTVIGKGSVIGGNTWITKSVPPGTNVYKNWE